MIVDYVPLLLSLFAVDLLAAMSPGPNFVLVTQTAVTRSRGGAGAVVLGFTLSNLLWCLAVVLGLSVLFEAAPWLYRTIKILGGFYLIYLGITLWVAKPRKAADPRPTNHSGAFVRGVLTNLSNPKSVVYFGSVFTVFLKPDAPLWVQAAAIGIVLLNTLLWYGALAMMFSAPAVQRGYARVQRPIDRVAGAVMAAFGARLIFARE